MPQISVNQFAKFIKASPSAQRTILRNSKFPFLKDGTKRPQIVRYSEARAAIRNYHEGGNDVSALVGAIEALTKKLALPGKDQARIRDNIRAVETYMKHFSKSPFKVLPTPRPKYEHAGVEVSTTPDLYVDEAGERKLIKLDFNQQKPDPGIIDIVLKVTHEAGSSAGLPVKPKNVIYLDVSRQIQYTGATLNKKLKKDIDAACETIADLWSGIKQK
ncbi:MAG TPA: hypothetical protein VMG82_14020 [Candidatus Sulfotelmatobacter sp.]|nr:hypothetical protein [Candidatus Sulfotelmatobacter sp.]